MFDKMWREIANLPQVIGIALGGSRASENYDEKSDYDLYLYVTAIPEDSVRRTPKQILLLYGNRQFLLGT